MPVPDDFEANTSTKIDAERDLNPLEWVYVTVTDVDLIEFDRKDGGKDQRIVVTVDPPVGKNGTTFICNRKRERALCKATGTKRVADWVGHRIAIQQGEEDFHGKSHKVVRVADVPPKEPTSNPHVLGENDQIPY